MAPDPPGERPLGRRVAHQAGGGRQIALQETAHRLVAGVELRQAAQPVVAVVFGAMNLGGGFVVTDRMLEMFKKKPRDKRG